MVANQIGSQGAGTVGKVGRDNGVQPPVVFGFIDKNGKDTIYRHAAGGGLIFGTIRNE